MRWLLACLVLAVFAVPAEWATRRWLVRPQEVWHEPGLGERVRPGTRVVQSREGWGSYTANSWGLLDDEPATAPGSLSGLLLGDSFAQGLQVRFGERFSERAEREVPGLSLLNAATGGRTPIQYALELPRFQQALRPRFVVVELNDVDLSELEEPAKWREASEEFRSAPSAPDPAPAPQRGLRGLFRRSSLLVMLRGRATLLWGQERQRLAAKLTGHRPSTEDPVARPVAAPVAAAMDSLLGVMQRVNPHLILLYIPHIDYYSTPPGPAYPARRAFFHALAARHALPLVDPTEALLAAYRRDGEPVHGFANTGPATGHLNVLGHAVVGHLLAAEIAREFGSAGGTSAGGTGVAVSAGPGGGGAR